MSSSLSELYLYCLLFGADIEVIRVANEICTVWLKNFWLLIFLIQSGICLLDDPNKVLTFDKVLRYF